MFQLILLGLILRIAVISVFVFCFILKKERLNTQEKNAFLLETFAHT